MTLDTVDEFEVVRCWEDGGAFGKLLGGQVVARRLVALNVRRIKKPKANDGIGRSAHRAGS